MKAALLFLSCAFSVSVFAQKAVTLELFQTTATQVGRPEHILDNNQATTWQAAASPKGMGVRVDMLLEEPRFIDAVEVRVPEGKDIVALELVIDHKQLVKIVPNTRTSLKVKAQHLAWRVSVEKHASSSTVFTGDALADVFFKPSSQSLEIGDILLFSDAGAEPLEVQVIPAVPGKVLASSVEEPATKYHPCFLFDGRHDFGWGTDHGRQGAGESVALSFDRPVRIEKIRIMDGQELPNGFGPIQVSRLSISVSGKKPVQVPFSHPPKWEGSFLDMAANTPGMTFGTSGFRAGAWKESAGNLGLEGNAFVVTVEEVLKGSAEKIFVLQEMEFWDGKKWFRMDVDQDLYQGEFVRTKNKGWAIGELLDQTLSFDCRRIDDPLSGKGMGQTTLCFQTDGSFYFRTDGLPGQAGSWLFDGTWESALPMDGVSQVNVSGTLIPLGGNASNAKRTPIHELIQMDSTRIWSHRLFGSSLLKLDESTLVPCPSQNAFAVDLRYKSADNFMQRALYSACMPCLLRQDTKDALLRAQATLDQKAPGKGYKLLIWDAYRPYSVQKEMWEKVPDTNYVADPYHGGSSHNKGAAIDLTLSLDGQNSIPMGTAFDFFGKEAHHGYKKLPKEVKANRLLLRQVMEAAGFQALESEWWHYRLPGSQPILDFAIECK